MPVDSQKRKFVIGQATMEAQVSRLKRSCVGVEHKA